MSLLIEPVDCLPAPRVWPAATPAEPAAATPPSPPLAPTPRNEAIDAARALAFVAIVMVHAIRSPQLSALGSIGTLSAPSLFYIYLALFFHARSFRRNPDRPVLPYLTGRVVRLYVPFLAWGLIYLVVNNVRNIIMGDPRRQWPEVAHLWAGTSPHLWFLPFLLVCLLVGSTVAPLCAAHAWARRSVAIAAAAGGIALLFIPRPDWLDYLTGTEAVVWLNSWKALPAALLGLAIAWGAPAFKRRLGARPATVLQPLGRAGVILMVIMIAMQLHSGYFKFGRTMSGLGWAVFALAGTHGAWVGFLARLGRYGYGAYLSHGLFVAFAHAGLKAAHVINTPAADVVMVIAGVVGGFGAAWLLNQSRATAWLNGGGTPGSRTARAAASVG